MLEEGSEEREGEQESFKRVGVLSKPQQARSTLGRPVSAPCDSEFGVPRSITFLLLLLLPTRAQGGVVFWVHTFSSCSLLL